MKTLTQFASFHHLTIDKNRGACYGRYQGYNVVVSHNASQKNYMIQLSVSSDEVANEQAKNYFFGLVSQYDFVHYANYASPNLTVSVKKKGKAGNNLDMMIDLIVRYLGMNGFKNACQSSKQVDKEVGIYSVQGRIYMLCEEAYQTICQSFDKFHQELPKENVGLGALGALLGSLVGVVLWMVFYRLGIIAAFSGSIMVYCSLKLYQKFGKTMSKKGLIISIVLSVIMIFVAEYLSLGLEIYLSLKDYYIMTILDAMLMVPSIALDSSIIMYVLSDLGFGYLFLFITSFSTVSRINKQLKNQNEASRLV